MCRYADMCHMEIIAPFSINVGGRKMSTLHFTGYYVSGVSGLRTGYFWKEDIEIAAGLNCFYFDKSTCHTLPKYHVFF